MEENSNEVFLPRWSEIREKKRTVKVVKGLNLALTRHSSQY